MNQLYNLFIILLINTGTSFAQKSGVLNVLLRTDLTVSPKNRLFVIDSVVDSRIDTLGPIGTWQYPNGKTAELKFKEGFRPSMTRFLVSSLPNIDEKLSAYALIIREFNLTGLPQINRAEFAVTFCKYNHFQQNTGITNSDSNSQWLIPLYTADVIVESNSDPITEVLKNGLAKIFSKFNEYLTNPNGVLPSYSDFASELAKAVQELNLVRAAYSNTYTNEDNLLRCNHFKPGIYQSFNDLRLNRPSLTGELMIKEKKGFANLEKPSGSRSRNRFLGFCDGKDIFISTGLYQSSGMHRQFAKVKSIGRYLLWIDNYLTSSEMAANAAGATFGLIGGLAAGAANSYKDCIALDMQTGGVFMVTKDKLPQMLAGHDDLLAELAALSNEKDEQQQFRLLDKLNQRIRPQITR